MIYAIIFLVLAVAAYSTSQLQIHGKLDSRAEGFWGELSWTRKYKDWPRNRKPAFRGATTWAIMLTDGYHFMQSLLFLFLSLSFGFIMEDWRYAAGAYSIVHFIHYFTYKLLSK